MAGANAVALALNFLTTLFTARAFGTSPQMDAYTLAISIPESLQYLLMLATLSVIFTPLFIDFRTRLGESDAWSLALSLLVWVGALVVLVIPLLAWSMPALIGVLAPGFPPDTRALAVELTTLILPGLLYYATAGLILGICYAYYDFWTAALNGVLLAGLNLIAFFALVQWAHLGVHGLLIGRLVALAILEIFLLARVRRHKRGIPTRWHWTHPELGTVLKLMPPYMFGALSGQLELIVNRSFVSTLGAGSVAAWGYGQRLADIPLAVLGAAVGTTFLPNFSAELAAGDKRAASESWNRAVLRVCVLLIPIAALIIALGEPLIALLFQRGSFDATSTHMSALVLAGLALGLPARGVGGLVVRGMPAFKSRVLPLVLSALSTTVNVALDFALVGWLGLFGIAVASSAGGMVFAIVGVFVFWRWLEVARGETLRGPFNIL